MAGIFTISPVNSLHFVRLDIKMPNFDNTLLYDKPIEQGIAHIDYHQKITTDDTLAIQLKTDYSSITAYAYDFISKTKTSLTVALKNSYTDFDIYEISTSLNVGLYKIFIDASLSGYANLHFVSEVFEVADSCEGVKMEFYNDTNTAYIDYSTGIIHFVRAFGNVAFSDVGGKEEFYNNFGVEERIYAENETIFELVCEKIPYYLCRQILYAGKLDHFKVNDCEYIVKEHALDRLRGSHLYNLTLKLTKKEVYGINTDFEANTFIWGTSSIDTGITIASESKTTLAEGMTSITVSATITVTGYSGGELLEDVVEIIIMKDGVSVANSLVSFNNGGSGSHTFTVSNSLINSNYDYNIWWRLV